MKPLIFIPTPEEKEKSKQLSHQFIESTKGCSNELIAYTLQMLIDSFEDVSGINIRTSISIGKNEKDKNS